MNPDQPSNPTPNRRIALLIDADNVSHAKIATILAELSRYGTANIRRAYGDWASAGLKGWKDKLHAFAIRPIQQFSYSAGKNATDIALVIDAMELLYTQKLDAFCIASSDADFTPLVMQLKANGHDVYGFGERKTPEPFVNACTTFLYLD
ncbi:MAG: NYN domain-containing protein, partial [Verrucomicrobiaceae bacterium]